MSQLNVALSGNVPNSLKDLAGAVIAKSLSDNGFTNVTTVNGVGEPTPTGNISTLADFVNQQDPTLFATQVRVINSPYVDDNATLDPTELTSNMVEMEKEVVQEVATV